jgi:hypothetical protein
MAKPRQVSPAPRGTLTPADLSRDSTAAASRPSVDDRRREPRLPCERQLTIRSLADTCRGGKNAGAAKTVGLFDCSGHGLGILCDEPMVVGDQFVACLKMRDRVSRVIYTVRHCQRWDKHFKIGAEMTSFLDAADGVEVEEIVDALLEGNDELKN